MAEKRKVGNLLALAVLSYLSQRPMHPYELSRMLRELPRTSKNTSPSRGNGAASDADMQPMVALRQRVCPIIDHL